ncbi:PIN domain-containing protein [Curtobacterium sp. ISL-83]|uniref:PIN domain-containing protein n=1 Tax=Curtobacterium sp. ISL-83 TaxID=2819145 RepID=UPI001BEAF967|nr:PIN domain-containing protein [Curtobacterium sp. ISL-83]MBT2501528.1 DUF4935 domain-containing protein [Curtobacterium sp. ISL-83]
MKTVLLDTTELRRDWTLTGLAMRLLSHARWQNLLEVKVPIVCLEELSAHHARQVAEANELLSRSSTMFRRLGLTPPEPPTIQDYRAYAEERLEDKLGFDLLPLPEVSHVDLVRRAVARIPPFDQKGSGYRDSLVWANAVALARQGREVILVTADRIFQAEGGELPAALAADLLAVEGTVTVVDDLTRWLLASLPWKATKIAAAVAQAQDNEFRHLLDSGAVQDGMEPTAEQCGFDRAPYSFRVDDIEWAYEFDRVGPSRTAPKADLVEYDMRAHVSFTVWLPEGSYVEEGWTAMRLGDRLAVDGELEMIARVALFFEHDMGMQIDDLDWRRSDGGRPGPGVMASQQDPIPFDL